MIRRFSPRGLEILLLIGIVSIAGFFLRGQKVLPLHEISDSRQSRGDSSTEELLVHVDVTPRSKADWDVEIVGRFFILSGADGKLLSEGKKLQTTRIIRRNNHWLLSPAPEGFKSHAGSLEIVPAPGAIFRLDKHRYRGSLLLSTTRSGRPVLINRVGLEQYVASVVDGEMPFEFGKKARCAQAVIARSFVLYQRQQAQLKSLPYDVHADTRSQFYPGYQYLGKGNTWYSGESAAGRECAELTRGLVCTDGKQLLCTYYSAICGGRTCKGTELFPDASPLLCSVMCEHCRDAPLYRWEKSLPLSRFQSRLQTFLRSKGAGNLNWKSWLVAGQKTTLPLFRVSDSSRSFSLSGLDLRNLWGGEFLHSPIVEIEFQKEKVILRGSGHGHGVGLCQWGARGLASQGKSYREILEFYYPGVRIVPYGTLESDPSIASESDPLRNGLHSKTPR